MSLSRNVNRAITYVLVIMVIVTGAQLVVGAAFGSSPIYVVVSKSMVPTLQVGDLVVTAPQAYSTIHVGQVIVFQEPNGQGTCPNPEGLTVVHRVVAVTPAGLITQGDDRVTNPHPDEPLEWPPIPSECVKGVVVLAVPYLGLVSMLVPPPWNYFLVALILIFVFLSELRGGEKDGRRGASRAAGWTSEGLPHRGWRGTGTLTASALVK